MYLCIYVFMFNAVLLQWLINCVMVCSTHQISRDDEAQRRAVTQFRQQLWGEIWPGSPFDYA